MMKENQIINNYLIIAMPREKIKLRAILFK